MRRGNANVRRVPPRRPASENPTPSAFFQKPHPIPHGRRRRRLIPRFLRRRNFSVRPHACRVPSLKRNRRLRNFRRNIQTTRDCCATAPASTNGWEIFRRPLTKCAATPRSATTRQTPCDDSPPFIMDERCTPTKSKLCKNSPPSLFPMSGRRFINKLRNWCAGTRSKDLTSPHFTKSFWTPLPTTREFPSNMSRNSLSGNATPTPCARSTNYSPSIPTPCVIFSKPAPPFTKCKTGATRPKPPTRWRSTRSGRAPSFPTGTICCVASDAIAPIVATSRKSFSSKTAPTLTLPRVFSTYTPTKETSRGPGLETSGTRDRRRHVPASREL
jgi:hypothetical protein